MLETYSLMQKHISQPWRPLFSMLQKKVQVNALLWHRTIQFIGVLGVTLILILRGSNRFWHPQLWFEDGPVYLQDAYNLPFWQSVFKPHFYARVGTGYYVMLPRFLAKVALLFNMDYVPTVFMLFAFVIAIAVCSIFVLNSFDWLIPSVYVRVFFCLVLAALPASYEILLRFLNFQWYLGILSFLLVLMDPPVRKVSRLVYVLTWIVLALSNPQTILFLPCLMARAWLRPQGRRVAWIGCFAILLGLAPTIWFNLTINTPHTSLPSPADIFLVLVNGVAMRVLVAATVGAARSYSWFYQTDLIYGYFWYIPYVIFTFAILVTFIRKKLYTALMVWLYTTYCIITPILLAAVRNPSIIDFGKDINTFWGGERYFVLPLAAFYFFFFWWLTTLPRTRISTYVGWFVLAFSITTAVNSDFYDPGNTNDQQWALQSQRIKHIESLPYTTTLRVPISPGGDWEAQLQIKPPLQEIEERIIFTNTAAQGSFDVAVSDQTTTKNIAETGQIFVGGWTTNMAGDGPADGILIVNADTQAILAYSTNHTSRQDIVVAMENPRLLWTGWQISFPANQLNVGPHTLQAYAVDATTRQAFPLGNTQSIEIVADSNGFVETAQGAKDMAVAPILPGQPVRQEFLATQPGLKAVELTFAVVNNEAKGPVTLYLQRLDEAGNGQYLATTTLDASTIEKEENILFTFPLQANSANQRYVVMVAAPEAIPDDALTAWMQSGNPYPAGRLTQGGTEVNGDLAFKLIYNRPIP